MRTVLRKILFLTMISVLGFVFVSGCGYSSALKRGKISSIDTLSIEMLTNSTKRPGVEGVITEALVQELSSMVTISSSSASDVDAIMSGEVVRYELKPLSYNTRSIVTAYRLKVTVSLQVSTLVDGSVTWSAKLSDYEDFSVTLGDVSVTKGRERLALERIAEDLAETLRERMTEEF